jgi:hypothetical protein
MPLLNSLFAHIEIQAPMFVETFIPKLTGWQSVYEDLSCVVLLPNNFIQPFTSIPIIITRYTREKISPEE